MEIVAKELRLEAWLPDPISIWIRDLGEDDNRYRPHCYLQPLCQSPKISFPSLDGRSSFVLFVQSERSEAAVRGQRLERVLIPRLECLVFLRLEDGRVGELFRQARVSVSMQ